MAEGNKNQWVIWLIVVGAVIITLIAFNYQGDKTEVIPLSELFPEEGLDETVQEVEFEFVDSEGGEVVDSGQSQVGVVPSGAVAAVPSQAVPVAVATATPSERYYTIQALSSKNKTSTEKALQKAKKNGYTDAFMITQDLKGRGVWHRIYIGKFSDKNQANARLSAVRKNYNDCFIKLIKNY